MKEVHRSRIAASFAWPLMIAIAGAAFGIMSQDAYARRGRGGPSPAQKKAQQEKAQEAAAMQKALLKARADKDKEILKRFDLNGNGKIDGTESGPWDKYWREVKLGTIPHPYSEIKLDKPAAKTASKKK
jgi:hypothetical protein